MTPFIFAPDLDVAEHGWTDVPDTPEIPPAANPFMAVVSASGSGRSRQRRRVAAALARIEREPNRPAAGRAGAELLAACALLAADDPQTLDELRAAVRLGSPAKPDLDTEVARLGYVSLLASAAGEDAVLAKRYALVAALRPLATMAPTRTAGRPFWTACRALNVALGRGDRRGLLRAALGLARAWGGVPRA